MYIVRNNHTLDQLRFHVLVIRSTFKAMLKTAIMRSLLFWTQLWINVIIDDKLHL